MPLTLLFIIRHFLIFILILGGVVLWLQREVNPKPRFFLITFCFGSALSITYSLHIILSGEAPTVNPILSITNLNCGFLELLLLYLYPIEVISPNWLTIKRATLLFLPWIVIIFFQIIVPIDFINLTSFSEVIEHIGDFNVWFRLLILCICIIPYTIILLCIPNKWQQNNINKRWVYKYVLGVQGMGLLYCVSLLTGFTAIKSIQLLYCSLFFFYIIYQELFLRLFPPPETKIPITPISIALTPLQEKVIVDTRKEVISNPLWTRLTVIMQEKELWREPDITLEDLSKRLYTNRTTLSTIIKQQGYSSYSEYINRQRIEAFVAKVKSGYSINIQKLFYDVGFRSKSTAIRNFRLYMGCTPSEYIQQITLQNKTK